jgi:hypothetical protein
MLITSVLALVIFDAMDQQKYNFFHKRPFEFQLNLSVIADNDDKLNEIAAVANANSIIIFYKTKESLSVNHDEVTTYYLVENQLRTLEKCFGLNQNSNFWSTVPTSKSTQINDFLDNDQYSYKLLNSEIMQEFDYITVAAKSEADFNRFVFQISKQFPNSNALVLNSSAIVSNDVLTILIIISIIALAILILLDIFVSTYYFISKSKEIGVMLLLGKTRKKTFMNLNFSTERFNIGVSGIATLLTIIFVKNITIQYITLLLFIFFSIFVLKLLFNYFFFFLLIRNKSKQSLLKNKSFNKTSYIITKMLKITFSVLLIAFIMVTYYEVKQVLNLYREYKKHEELNRWTIISSFQPDGHYLTMSYEEQMFVNNQIYNYLNTHHKIFYVQTMTSQMMQKDYMIADLNYLQRYNLYLDSYEGKNLIILIPESLKEKEDEVKVSLKKEIDQGYTLKYYPGGEFNTYKFYTKSYLVRDPIIKIFNPKSLYISEMFGQGLNTSLKIDAQADVVYESLSMTLTQLGIDKTFNQNSFVSISQEKQNRIDLSLYTMYFIAIVGIIIVFTHILLIFNYCNLFLSKFKKELSVRAFLGHSYFELIDRDLYRNLVLDVCVSIAFMILYSVFIAKSLDYLLVMIIGVIPILNYGMSIWIHQSRKRDSLLNFLKGDDL